MQIGAKCIILLPKIVLKCYIITHNASMNVDSQLTANIFVTSMSHL